MSAGANTPESITTPDRVESRLGTLEFEDGAPSPATAELLYDHLDFMHWGAGVHQRPPRCVVGGQIFSELMDSASLFLTANCDTVYFITQNRAVMHPDREEAFVHFH